MNEAREISDLYNDTPPASYRGMQEWRRNRRRAFAKLADRDGGEIDLALVAISEGVDEDTLETCKCDNGVHVRFGGDQERYEVCEECDGRGYIVKEDA